MHRIQILKYKLANTNTDAEYDADEGGRGLDCGLVPIIVLLLPGKLKQIRVNQIKTKCKYGNTYLRLGDILSQGQIVPTAFLGRQIVPSDKMSHFLPRDKLSHQTNCPISSPETKCPTDALIKNHCSTGIFRETNCPIRQIVPLSPRRQNVPTYALMHKKVMESCWDILSPVILSNFWETFERLLRDF